jgi:hypothetical protein
MHELRSFIDSQILAEQRNIKNIINSYNNNFNLLRQLIEVRCARSKLNSVRHCPVLESDAWFPTPLEYPNTRLEGPTNGGVA